MANLFAAEVVVPATLSASAKRALEDELYDVHARIFDGVDKAAFVKYVIDSSAAETSIQLYRDREGRLGGYMAIHFFEKKLDGRDVAVMRAETGTLREHRGANIMFRFTVNRVLSYMARHPMRPLYILGSLVHPSSYAQLARYADRVWPNPDVETPAEMTALVEEMARAFGMQRIDDANPLVRKVGWRTRDSGADRRHWTSSENRWVRFFLERNPGYSEGHGLLTLAPVNAAGVARGIGRYAAALANKRAERAFARLRGAARPEYVLSPRQT